MKKNGWQWFLILFSPAILIAWGVTWLLNFYLKDIEKIEKTRGKE